MYQLHHFTLIFTYIRQLLDTEHQATYFTAPVQNFVNLEENNISMDFNFVTDIPAQ